MDIVKNVNITRERETDTFLRQVLREWLESVPWLSVRAPRRPGARGSTARKSAWDFWLELKSGKRTVSLAVESRSSCEPRVFRELAERRAGEEAVKVLGVLHATPRLTEVCAEEGWSWFDGAGNGRLDIPGWLFVERTGRPPVRAHRVREPNLRSPEAARVVRALLSVDNAGKRWVQREMVHHFEGEPGPIPPPSLALVNKLVRELAAQDLLTTSGRGFEVCDPNALLKLWGRQYPYERQTRRRYHTLLREEQIDERLAELAPGDDFPVVYGVFSAAIQQAPHVLQPRVWLYVPPARETELVRQLGAKPVESGDNLVLLTPDDPGVFYRLDRDRRIPCTNLVQTYADLCQAGGRGKEGAEAMRTERLLPGWNSRP